MGVSRNRPHELPFGKVRATTEYGTAVLRAKAAVLVLAGSMTGLASAQQPTAPSLVIDGVTVVDVESGKLLPAQRVVIAGNRIQRVGPLDQVQLSQPMQVVDARGKYLIPGLWDMHTHATNGERTDALFYTLFLANGLTGMRDASSSVPLDTLRLWRQAILAGTRVGPPRQVLSGPMIQSSCGDDPIACVTLDPDDDSTKLAAHALRLVDSLKSAGADMIKLRDLFPATTYFVLAAAARQRHMPFGGHVWDSIDVAASDSGARIIDHFVPWYNTPAGLRIWCWGTLPTASLDRCQPVAEGFKRNHTWIVPTTAIYIEVGQIGEFGKMPATRRSRLLLARLHKRTDEFLKGALLHGNWLRDSAATSTLATAAADDSIVPDSLGILSLVQRTGLPVAAGTDVFPAFFERLLPGFALHAELAIYVAEGLTPLRALQSATLEPAKLLNATDSLGTVAPGKLADLVLLDANPLADITNTTTIRAVVANGRYFDRAALDSLLVKAQALAKER